MEGKCQACQTELEIDQLFNQITKKQRIWDGYH